MKPETRAFLGHANQCLSEAQQFARIGYFRVAIREAYLAAHHAARAAVFESLDTIPKTHSGVRTQFARIAVEYDSGEQRATKFLADAYAWKEIADYEPTSATARFDRVLAEEAVARATDMVVAIERVLKSNGA